MYKLMHRHSGDTEAKVLEYFATEAAAQKEVKRWYKSFKTNYAERTIGLYGDWAEGRNLLWSVRVWIEKIHQSEIPWR